MTTVITTDTQEPAVPGTTSADVAPVAAGPGRPHRTGGLAGPARFAGQVVAWVVILVLLAALTAAVLVPRLVGGTAFTVLTGSMTPTYPAGTLIVDRPVDPADIGIGTPVTFQIESGKPDVVTHRVIAVRTGADGEPEFLTQGDANASPDADWRPAAAVRGEVWYALPHLGRIDGVLSGHTRQLGIYLVAGMLVVYAAANLLGAARDRRRDT